MQRHMEKTKGAHSHSAFRQIIAITAVSCTETILYWKQKNKKEDRCRTWVLSWTSQKRTTTADVVFRSLTWITLLCNSFPALIPFEAREQCSPVTSNIALTEMRYTTLFQQFTARPINLKGQKWKGKTKRLEQEGEAFVSVNLP